MDHSNIVISNQKEESIGIQSIGAFALIMSIMLDLALFFDMLGTFPERAQYGTDRFI